jgi:hypothetical protein
MKKQKVAKTKKQRLEVRKERVREIANATLDEVQGGAFCCFTMRQGGDI